MRRIKLVLAAVAVMVAAFAAFSGPALADDLNCRDAWGNLIRCDGQFYTPVNDWWNTSWDNNWGNNWWWNNSWDNNWRVDEGCPFWGDTSGVVNQWDCFD
jgi:hypothetical protein